MRSVSWGVTGTRTGGTPHQIAAVGWLFSRYGITEEHNGDCVGVDEQLYHVGRAFSAHIEIHPPKGYRFRAFCGDNKDHWWPEQNYFVRDRDIVNESQALVSCPRTAFEEANSGTWYTIDYARSSRRPIAIVYPNGHIAYENWTLEQIE